MAPPCYWKPVCSLPGGNLCGFSRYRRFSFPLSPRQHTGRMGREVKEKLRKRKGAHALYPHRSVPAARSRKAEWFPEVIRRRPHRVVWGVAATYTAALVLMRKARRYPRRRLRDPAGVIPGLRSPVQRLAGSGRLATVVQGFLLPGSLCPPVRGGLRVCREPLPGEPGGLWGSSVSPGAFLAQLVSGGVLLANARVVCLFPQRGWGTMSAFLLCAGTVRLKEEKRTEKKFSAPAYLCAEC